MIKEFLSGYVRRMEYDPQEKQLDIQFDNSNTLAYKGVPLWVFEKMSRDPSPKSFWEDNIKDEYSPTQPKKTSSSSSMDSLKNLFGDPS
ncbi:hypothetical protein PSHI8_09190 [Polynucleobacter sp. SHI8]|uniref:KTSC domain-containing protein n=1 Tax=unclassified Polynucleobacter TaxID=2640945 RepID=UPI0024925787|nr:MULTISPECIES: KTSC domain-containing protein [unclassified Polynucleobacter]BDW10837.1 hypothetical protein PSHI2_09190 [Polynucleobacter sp. SHI2]BDW13283.1 hypothetical protein PSHI8_09190 [Polynucleobacter sp. SHI8]